MANPDARYRSFADHEAHGISARYEEFARGVSEDPAVLSLLAPLDARMQQPNLLFAAVKYLTGVLPDYAAFRAFVLDHDQELLGVMRARSTQTNEPGRCAILLPLLASLPQPLALLEAGAAAGLCLMPDRYAYDYDGHRVGPVDAAVALACAPSGPVPIPERLPEIVWRRGIDLHPLDVTDPDTAEWQTALVWAGNEDREERVRVALLVAASDPPVVLAGDMVEHVASVAEGAPAGATLVVFHSAVMPYLSRSERDRFAEIVKELPAEWISLEGPGALRDVDDRLPAGVAEPGAFVLAHRGTPLAVAHPHGRWIRWFEPAGQDPPDGRA